MNPICSSKPCVPMSSTFIRKHSHSLTTVSQVLALSSDLASVCICRNWLPLLPIRAQRVMSACPQLNPGHKNNANFWGWRCVRFLGAGCSIWGWRSQAFPLTLTSWPPWHAGQLGQRKPFPFNSAQGALYGTWPCAPLNLLDLRPDVHDLGQISLHAFSGWACWLRGCGTATTQPD